MFAGDGAATPLTPEERDGLILEHITQRNELNEFEQRGVEEGEDPDDIEALLARS